MKSTKSAPKRKHTSVVLDAGTANQIKAIAKRDRRSASFVIGEAVEAYLKKNAVFIKQKA